MELKFKFTLDQMVTTPFNQPGIVVMLGYDDGGIQYAVKTESGTTWFKENQIK